MEKEIFEKNNRFSESKLYQTLRDLHPKCYELYLSSLIKVARSGSPKELLEITDTLLGFVCNNERSGVNKMLIDTTVDEILPILNTRNSEVVKNLVSNEYQTIFESFEQIRESEDKEIASKCLFGEAILVFPGSKILKGELDS